MHCVEESPVNKKLTANKLGQDYKRDFRSADPEEGKGKFCWGVEERDVRRQGEETSHVAELRLE